VHRSELPHGNAPGSHEADSFIWVKFRFFKRSVSNAGDSGEIKVGGTTMKRITKTAIERETKAIMADDPSVSESVASKMARIHLTALVLTEEIFATHPVLKKLKRPASGKSFGEKR
jgi:hypothetical protein